MLSILKECVTFKYIRPRRIRKSSGEVCVVVKECFKTKLFMVR